MIIFALFALEMPSWLTVMMWTAGGLAAAGAIYAKGLKPLSKFIAETERSVPVLKAVTDKLSDPDIIDVIVAMAKQFQTDSGSSLRDVVNRLEAASIEATRVSDILRVTMEGTRQLQDADRTQIARLLVLLDRIQLQADMNTGRIMVASDAAAALAAGVATDLADSHTRASQAGSEPGESADAFSTQPVFAPPPPPPPPPR